MQDTHTLPQLANRIRDWQTKHGISDNDLCKRFAGLGSTKTYKRILTGDTTEIDLDRWALQYEQVCNLIELDAITSASDEPVYDDLPNVVRVRLAVADSLAEKGNNRLVIVEGASGSGKSTAGRKLAERFVANVILAEADETWKESLSNMLGGLLRSLGLKTPPNGSEARKQTLIDKLRETPSCIVLDEAHHLGPRTLNLVKTLLNQTPCQFVFLAIPTLLRRLESSAFEEARQLTKNRLCERVSLDGCDVSSVEKFITRRLSITDGIARTCAKLLAERSVQFGLWNYVNLVCRKIREQCHKDDVTMEDFQRGMQTAAATR